MATAQTYPYSDEYMIFDDESRRYILTPRYALEQLGIDLEGAIKERGAVNPQVIVKQFLTDVSDDIYEFMHEHCINTAEQDRLVAVVPSLRSIIQKAMAQQLLYSRFNGLLGYSVEKDKQAQRICPKSVSTLSQSVPELGTTILYTGFY